MWRITQGHPRANHFTGYRVSFPILFRKKRRRVNSARLPHSEIFGSAVVCTYPKLIAAYHVLHRLLAPRHSLCALQSLIPCLKSAHRDLSLIRRSLRSPCSKAPSAVSGSTTLAVKNINLFWESEYIQGPRKNDSRGSYSPLSQSCLL